MVAIQKSGASQVRKGKQDHIILFDSLADIRALVEEKNVKINSDNWAGGLSPDRAKDFLLTGDPSQVAKSDEYMERLESLIKIDTHAMQWRDSVAGAFPNIPAYISGHPLAMRQRVRNASEFAPLAIVVDTVISAGISEETIQKRGSTILALVRLLGAVRPLELYVCAGMGARSGGAHWYFAKINTNPLDLASAGFALCHPSFPRGVCYETARTHQDKFDGRWPYHNAGPVAEFHTVCKQWLPHIEEFLALPGAYYDDPAVTDPEKWIREQLAIFAPMVATE